ncbi:hypothetical protein DSECCO2_516080 [anaerobic digester metagenome]
MVFKFCPSTVAFTVANPGVKPAVKVVVVFKPSLIMSFNGFRSPKLLTSKTTSTGGTAPKGEVSSPFELYFKLTLTTELSPLPINSEVGVMVSIIHGSAYTEPPYT